MYTDESVADVLEAIDAVERNYPYTRQDEVDEFAFAIDDAVSMLKYKPADYTQVDEAIARANAEIHGYVDGKHPEKRERRHKCNRKST